MPLSSGTCRHETDIADSDFPSGLTSMAADLADQIMASELFASRRDETEVRRVTAAQAADIRANAASDI